MPLLSNFNAATYALNGFDSETEEGSSTVEFLNAAAKRPGGCGMRITISGDGNEAYVTKDDIGLTFALGGTVYLGFWMNATTLPAANDYPIGIRQDDLRGSWNLRQYSDGTLKINSTDDAAAETATAASADISGAWHWIVMELIPASAVDAGDGGAALWIDGTRGTAVTTVDNDTRGTGTMAIRIGVASSADDGHIVDFDDLVVSESYPRPPEGHSTTGTGTNQLAGAMA